ncbi:hypothetical protein GALL_270380 [mine drainage metagenome]|uniref:DoxX n=1 Tax=mine drainage metagenome TaxID=410659 RepID=A0A1J5R520_9ZZZZ
MKTLLRLPVALTALFQRLPHAVIALAARMALANVFWQSGQAKLGNWDGTLFLFSDSYKVPLLPPDLAAYMSVSLELSMPILLILGLGTRFAALALLGMTAVIQIFVMPNAWPIHIQWLAMMLVLIGQGGGTLSVDAVLSALLKRRSRALAQSKT